MHRSRPISLALVGLFVWVTGCTTYTQIEVGEVADHSKVRVTFTDGNRRTIHDPRVEADSIVSEDASAIPLADVVRIQAVGTNEVGTVFLVLGVVALVTAMAVAVCESEECMY